MNKHLPYLIPSGVVIAVISAAYTLGERDGGSDRDIASLERRVEKISNEVTKLESRVENLKANQALLEYQIRQLEGGRKP